MIVLRIAEWSTRQPKATAEASWVRLYRTNLAPLAGLPPITRCIGLGLLQLCDEGGRISCGEIDPGTVITRAMGATGAARREIFTHVQRLIDSGYLAVEKGAVAGTLVDPTRLRKRGKRSADRAQPEHNSIATRSQVDRNSISGGAEASGITGAETPRTESGRREGGDRARTHVDADPVRASGSTPPAGRPEGDTGPTAIGEATHVFQELYRKRYPPKFRGDSFVAWLGWEAQELSKLLSSAGWSLVRAKITHSFALDDEDLRELCNQPKGKPFKLTPRVFLRYFNELPSQPYLHAVEEDQYTVHVPDPRHLRRPQ